MLRERVRVDVPAGLDLRYFERGEFAYLWDKANCLSIGADAACYVELLKGPGGPGVPRIRQMVAEAAAQKRSLEPDWSGVPPGFWQKWKSHLTRAP